jgi:small subunit ribosomal protein S10
MNLPPNVQSVYLRPLRRAPTHGIPVCDLQMRSYSVRNLEFFADFAMRAAYYLGLPAKGPVPLPQITERWTVPRGPFVHKKSQENFERKTLRRLIQIQDGHPEVVQAWLAYLEKRAYYGIGMKANVWEWEEFDVAKKMDGNAEVVAEQTEETSSQFGVRDAALQRLEESLGKESLPELLTLSQDVRRHPKEIKRQQ